MFDDRLVISLYVCGVAFIILSIAIYFRKAPDIQISSESRSSQSYIKPGENWFIRTVTNYNIGQVECVTSREIIFKKGTASWIASTGRFHNFMRIGADIENCEVEPFGDVPVVLNRESIVDATPWPHKLPLEQK